MKRILRKILGKACLKYEEMSTVLCDCESIINARPLTYLSEDPRDLTPISPNMFLQEVREIGVPDCDFIDREKLKGRFKYRQHLKDELRKRFRTEYLGELKYNGNKRTSETRRISIGDIVLIGNDCTKRLDWPLGRVIETFPGKDGVIRVVRLITASGQLVRPIQRLYPLEVDFDVVPEQLHKLYKKGVNKARDSKDEKEKASLSKAIEQKIESVPYKTRSGRTVKPVIK